VSPTPFPSLALGCLCVHLPVQKCYLTAISVGVTHHAGKSGIRGTYINRSHPPSSLFSSIRTTPRLLNYFDDKPSTTTYLSSQSSPRYCTPHPLTSSLGFTMKLSTVLSIGVCLCLQVTGVLSAALDGPVFANSAAQLAQPQQALAHLKLTLTTLSLQSAATSASWLFL
jgi:hypothetical protein